jgi:hypothetical protein
MPNMPSEKLFHALNRKLSISIVLITNAFVWYYLAISLLKDIIPQATSTVIWTAHFGGIGFSAIAGALLLKKIKNRTNFLILWLIMGTISSALPLGLSLVDFSTLTFFSLFLGIS